MPASTLDEKPFPKAALIAAGALIVATVAGVGTLQLSRHFAALAGHNAGSGPSQPAPIETRRLRFVDAGDGVNVFAGHVRVFDAITGAEFPPLRDRDGFVRATLNALAFERVKRGIEAPPVFELDLRASGRLTLEDPATGAAISLGSFGPGNKAVFLRFLDRPKARP